MNSSTLPSDNQQFNVTQATGKDSLNGPPAFDQEICNVVEAVLSDPCNQRKIAGSVSVSDATEAIKSIVRHALIKPEKTLEADRAELGASIANLRIKVWLQHGILCGIFDQLSLPGSARTSLRDINRCTELTKGWLGAKANRKVSVGFLRKNPQVLALLDTPEIFQDLDVCGSLKKFRERFCAPSRKQTALEQFQRGAKQLAKLFDDMSPEEQSGAKDAEQALHLAVHPPQNVAPPNPISTQPPQAPVPTSPHQAEQFELFLENI